MRGEKKVKQQTAQHVTTTIKAVSYSSEVKLSIVSMWMILWRLFITHATISAFCLCPHACNSAHLMRAVFYSTQCTMLNLYLTHMRRQTCSGPVCYDDRPLRHALQWRPTIVYRMCAFGSSVMHSSENSSYWSSSSSRDTFTLFTHSQKTIRSYKTSKRK